MSFVPLESHSWTTQCTTTHTTQHHVADFSPMGSHIFWALQIFMNLFLCFSFWNAFVCCSNVCIYTSEHGSGGGKCEEGSCGPVRLRKIPRKKEYRGHLKRTKIFYLYVAMTIQRERSQDAIAKFLLNKKVQKYLIFFKITFKIFKSPASLHDNKSQLLTIVPSRKGGGGDSGGLTNNMLRNFSLSPSLSEKHNLFSLESGF